MKINIDFPRKIYKGDAFDFTLTVNADLTDYKVRAMLVDRDGENLQLANTAAGGGDTQVTLTPGASSTIIVYVPKDETTTFLDETYVEVQVEDTDGKPTTLFSKLVPIFDRQISWEEPS